MLIALAIALPGAALAAPPAHAGQGNAPAQAGQGNPFKNQMDDIQAKIQHLRAQGMGSSTPGQYGTSTATSTPDGKPTLTGIENAMQRIRDILEKLNAKGINPPGLSNALNKLQCISLNRNLVRGAQGDDVRQLQQSLIGEGDLDSDSATGFFGPKTEKALQKWQAKRGIVATGTPATTGFGSVGPRTRTILANCFGNGNGNGTGTSTPPTTPSDLTTPLISSITIGDIGSTTATISWTTNELATSKVYYGTTAPLDLSTALNAGSASSTFAHIVTLSGLTGSTTYYAVLESKDPSNNTATSSQQMFTTN